MFLVQVTVSSPLSLYPSLQLRDRTVPEETGNCLSVFMLVQVVFRLVQSEKVAINIITSSLFLNDLTILVTILALKPVPAQTPEYTSPNLDTLVVH